MFALIFFDGDFDLPQHLLIDFTDCGAKGSYGAWRVEIEDTEEIFVFKIHLRIHAAAGHEGVGYAERGGIFECHLDVVIIILLQI